MAPSPHYPDSPSAPYEVQTARRASDRLPRRTPHFLTPSGLGWVRVGFFGALLTVAAIRLILSPPIPPAILSILGTWLVVVAVFRLAPPRRVAWLPLLLRFGLYAFEVAALVLVLYRLGASGLLTLLFLTYLTIEINLLLPGWPGLLGSILATVAAALVVSAEATGLLTHDPFFSVAHPLYREPAYLVAILILGAVMLVALPVMLARRFR